ncbi:hypothetical protein JTB14_037144 [Gonioctena quinquepunctata]|nr:hypothetical protein JTB14_037144 [Gonioctena quinquepunctata]
MSFSGIDAQIIIEEIQQNRTELKIAIDASEARIQLRIEESYKKIRKLEAENYFLKNKVEKLERQQISNNIVVFGLNKHCHEISLDFIKDELKTLLEIEITANQVGNIHCLGSQINCPVKIEFVSN